MTQPTWNDDISTQHCFNLSDPTEVNENFAILKDDIDTLEASVSANTISIEGLLTDVSANTLDIADLKTSVSTNTLNISDIQSEIQTMKSSSVTVPQAINKAPDGILDVGTGLVPVFKAGVKGNFVKDGYKLPFAISADTNLDSFPASSTKYVFAIFDDAGNYLSTDYVDDVQRGFGVVESSVTDGDYYYDGFDMLKGESGSWVQKNAVCLGKITSDATSITEVMDIALNGICNASINYHSNSNTEAIVILHKMFIPPKSFNLLDYYMVCTESDLGHQPEGVVYPACDLTCEPEMLIKNTATISGVGCNHYRIINALTGSSALPTPNKWNIIALIKRADL